MVQKKKNLKQHDIYVRKYTNSVLEKNTNTKSAPFIKIWKEYKFNLL